MSYLDAVADFLPQVVETMRTIIRQKQADQALKDEFVNPILREDIFHLLSKCCTVIYYPLEQEENDGFHISLPVNEEICHFVYINTAKKLEKQIYAAAHELGHIWNVDDTLRAEGLDLPKDHDKEDAAMNRFAAELLMPEDLFRSAAYKKLVELQMEPGKISEENMFRAIAYLMDEYFVPFEAAVRRMEEVGILNGDTCRWLIKERYKKEDGSGKKLLEDCISEGGYTKLQANINYKRAITGFPELLNEVDAKGLFTPGKVSRLRELLNLPKVESPGGTTNFSERS